MPVLLEPRDLVRDTGWFKANLGDVQVVYLDAFADSANARFLNSLRADIDAIVPGRRRGILYEVSDRVRISAAQRQQVAQLFQERREALRAGTSGYALVTPSMLVRGFLVAVFWFAPPPYPYAVEGELRPALDFLASKQESIDPESVLMSYAALKRKLGV